MGSADEDQAGRARRELEQRLELTYAAVSEGIWDWDVRNDDLVWSDRFIELVGLAREGFTPRVETFFERLHPEDRARIEGALQDHLAHGTPYDVEYRLRHEDGRYIHVHALGQAIWDPQGAPVRMVGSVEDVTEQVATRAALKESEARFRDLAANLPGAIFRYVLHEDGTDEIEYMSPGCIAIWEVDAATIEGDPTALWELVVEEDFPAMRESVMRSGQTLEPWSHKWRIRPRSGQEKWLHGRGVPSRREDGATVWNTLILEITEQVRTEQALQESRELFHRAQRMEAIGQLTGGLAHDFNNLLGIILGNLELLGDFEGLGAHRDHVDDALEAVRRGSDLTRSLLAFARRATLEPEPVVLPDVAADLQRMLRHTLPENIELGIRVEADLPPLLLDRSALESALLNLVLNARDAIRGPGRINLAFSSTVAEDDEGVRRPHVRIRVADDGQGIDPEVLPRIVEPFFTTKAQRGNGLGLSMVDGFVRQSGGAMRIDSEPGAGTAVTLRFPVPAAGALAERRREPEEPGQDGAPVRGTLLVVEDEAELRKILCKRLRAEGYTVLGAADAAEALRVYEARQDRIDLLLTDFVMPGRMQGPDLAAALRSRQPDLAIIYLSGYVDVSHARYAKEYLRADARLFKPVGKIALLRTVRQVLARADSHPAA